MLQSKAALCKKGVNGDKSLTFWRKKAKIKERNKRAICLLIKRIVLRVVVQCNHHGS